MKSVPVRCVSLEVAISGDRGLQDAIRPGRLCLKGL